ncbi:MAG: GntR family transcriptional regulator [Betaproteobacteria bacterium]|nr:GntR family transcriptional regulator [Betaproteobacteria bacterium]
MATSPSIELEDLPAAADDQVTPRFAPLYRQIKTLLTKRLQAGEWKPGEPIPSETELAARYRVSQGTVRKAIDELAANNLLVRRQGRGTFVASHLEVRTQFRFLRLRPDDLPQTELSGEPSASMPGERSVQGQVLRSQVIECRRMRGPAEIARVLQLRAGEPLVQVHRVLDLEGKPTVLDEIWLPGARFRGLTAERLANYSGPLYALLEAEFGVRMIRAEERIKAVAAPAGVAAVLHVKSGTPLLRVDRVSKTYDEAPVEFRRGWCLTERHHYYNELG